VNIHQMAQFTSGGDARFSITRKSTGAFHIYRVMKQDRYWSVEYKIKIGKQYLYDQLGIIQAGIFYPSLIPDRDPEAMDMFKSFFLCLTEPHEGCRDLVFNHMGRCSCCRRLLSTKESFESGQCMSILVPAAAA